MTSSPARRLLVVLLDPSSAVDERMHCAIEQLIEGLLADDPALGDAVDFGVVACRRTDNKVEVTSLLPVGDGRLIVPLSDLRAMDPPERRGLVVLAPTGEPTLAEGLATAHWLTASWVAAHPDGHPPVVVVCATGSSPDPVLTRSLRALTASGPTRVIEFRFDPKDPPECAFPDEDIRRLLTDSAELPTESEVFIDDGPAFEVVREFWTAKHGNDPHQWEDGYAVEAALGRVAVADGASEGIFCRAWARQLAESYVAEPPGPEGFAEWTSALRRSWWEALDFPNLRWAAQNKVNEVGAAATLLGLTFGPARPDGSREWRALAVGDACLFWVRDGRPRAVFPVVHFDQLTSAPPLVRTKAGVPARPVTASGVCRLGDLFLLATDAVSGRLFREDAPLDRYTELAADEWAAELEALRAAGRLVNDDYTLLVLRVLGAAAPVEPLVDEPQAVAAEVAVTDPLP